MTPVIDVRVDCARWSAEIPGVRRLCRETVLAALAAAEPDLGAAELGVVLTDDAAIAALNRDFRNRDAPTNVLAFASESPGAGGPPPTSDGAPRLLGDVVVAYETAAAEAQGRRIGLADHARHLIVHGVLHLLGYDHEADEEADRMEALEAAVLARFGLCDPYRDEERCTA